MMENKYVNLKVFFVTDDCYWILVDGSDNNRVIKRFPTKNQAIAEAEKITKYFPNNSS